MVLKLPPPVELERRTRIVAFLDNLIEEDSSTRYYHFDPKWARGERVFSMSSGEGDDAFVWFCPAGVLVRGRHNERRPVPADRLFAGLPKGLARGRDERAFDVGGDSFATWSLGGGPWQSAVDPRRGGMNELLAVLDGDARTFVAFARDYYELKLDRATVAALYDGAAVDPPLVAALSNELDPARASKTARQLGLPSKGSPVATKKKTAVKSPARASDEDDETLGDAEFKIIEVRGEARLVIGGKVQLRSKKDGLYRELLATVRAAFRK